MKQLAVAFTGPSNSGKTTLIIKIATYLQKQGYKVAIIKHDPHDKGVFDTEGKDSYRFSQTGADVAVISPTRTTVFKKSPSPFDEVVGQMGDFDYLLVEGLKTLPLPRLAIFRGELNPKYFDVSDAIATDETISRESIPEDSEHLDLNDLESILAWIEVHAKKC
jgi:molybdopterin-guanine dinucleotide biosynthesis protein B